MLQNITLWGVIASPYLLKMQALADYSCLPWRRLPDQGSWAESTATLLRLTRAKRRGSVRRYPNLPSSLDEYPSVPFYSLDKREFFYDSSALAQHLDTLDCSTNVLLPDAAELRFICRLIDEAFDEFGLYMVHHNRWAVSASSNCMGSMTAGEFHSLLPGFFRRRMASQLAQRQVRRCPYLFSVAPADFDCGMPAELTPPARDGFPPTHDLLNGAWRRYLSAMEQLLEQQPYLLGDRFTLADASAYGQLGMNLVDGIAAEKLQELAPRTYHWLCDIRDAKHQASRGELYLSPALVPLLQIINETFIPLMQQNEAAYKESVANEQTLFNEAAFDRHQALYDGQLMGHAYRAVVKTFQVAVWRELRADWDNVPAEEKYRLLERYPQLNPADFEE